MKNISISNQKSFMARNGMDVENSIWMEECAELGQAISKAYRLTKTGKTDDMRYEISHLIEKIADVWFGGRNDSRHR